MWGNWCFGLVLMNKKKTRTVEVRVFYLYRFCKVSWYNYQLLITNS